MNAAESGPMSPQQRDVLQRHYDRASAILRMEQPDFDAAGESLYQCVVGEPSNSIFIEAFLICFSRKYDHNGSGSRWQWFAPRSQWRGAVAANDKHEVIRTGLSLLQVNPWNEPVLASLADATAELNALDAADRYLLHALSVHADSSELLRKRARLQTQIGDFDLAELLWSRVLELDPNDAEAKQEREFLAREENADDQIAIQNLEKQLENNPFDTETALQLADRLEAAGTIQQAQTVISQSLATSGKDLRLTTRAEELQLSHLRRRLSQATAYERRDSAPWSQKLIEQLNHEIQNREIELFSQRAARESGDVQTRVHLAEKLQKVGNYPSAVKWWEEIRRTDGLRSLACLRAGECLSHMRQFERALACFVTAIEANDGDADLLISALRHGAKLAAATGRDDLAEKYTQRLAQM